jgi:hypothetical protein
MAFGGDIQNADLDQSAGNEIQPPYSSNWVSFCSRPYLVEPHMSRTIVTGEI